MGFGVNFLSWTKIIVAIFKIFNILENRLWFIKRSKNWQQNTVITLKSGDHQNHLVQKFEIKERAFFLRKVEK